jgi:hypothetical protein
MGIEAEDPGHEVQGVVGLHIGPRFSSKLGIILQLHSKTICLYFINKDYNNNGRYILRLIVHGVLFSLVQRVLVACK